MLQLLQGFWQIMLLRAGPQDMPASLPLLKVLAVLLGVVNTLFWVMAGEPVVQELIGSIGYLLLTGAFFALLLHQRGVLSRWPQTLIACFGTDLIFAAIQLPLTLGFTEETVSLWHILALFLLLVWMLAVTTHIIFHAAGVSKIIAVFLCLGYGLLTFGMIEMVGKIVQ